MQDDIAELKERISALESRVAAMASLLQQASPKENARKLKVLTNIVVGMAQSLRVISSAVSRFGARKRGR